MQTNSASGTGNLASKYSFPPLPRCFEEFRPSCDAERISCLCLQNGAVSYEDFESLISVLPPDHELGSAGSESKTFTTGAYVYSCKAGLRSNVCKFPATTKLLASILSSLFPARHFTSAGLFRQLRAPPHVDTNNQPGCPNLLVPASDFENGAVWVEGPGDHEFFVNGQKRFGTLLDVANGPCELDAQRLHATCSWSGTRLILVGFCVANCATLEPGLAARLDALGFLLPDAQLRKKMRVHASTAQGSPANEVSLTPIGFSPALSPQDADTPVLRRPTPPLGSSPLGYPGPKPHTGLTSCDRAPSPSEPPHRPSLHASQCGSHNAIAMCNASFLTWLLPWSLRSLRAQPVCPRHARLLVSALWPLTNPQADPSLPFIALTSLRLLISRLYLT